MNPRETLFLLKLRNLIADKEFETACASRELQQFGQWQSDHPGAIKDINVQIAMPLNEYEEYQAWCEQLHASYSCT